MPILRKWEYNGAICGVWRVTETAEELRSLLTEKSFTSDFENYKSLSRQLEYLAVRVLLLELIGRECRILHFESGKPYLEGLSARISVSHTKGFVAVIIHPEKEVGIDIEYHSDRVRRVVDRFVSSEEMSQIEKVLSSLPDGVDQEDVRTNMYLLLWSAKETMFKMMNTSEVDFVKHLCIDSILLSDECYKRDALGFSNLNGVMHACEHKSLQSVKMCVEFCISDEFVCTYSCMG